MYELEEQQDLEEQEIGDMDAVCQSNKLTIQSDATTLLRAAEALLREARSIHAQVAGDPVFLRELTDTIDNLETPVSKLKSSSESDLQLIKLTLINKLRVLEVLICGENLIVTEINHKIDLAMQALTEEKERTGNTFPEIDTLVKTSCDQLALSAQTHSSPLIHAYDESLQNVVDFVNSVPAPVERPLDLSLLAIGFTLGAGAVFAFLLLAYLFARRGSVSRVGFFSNNYRAVHNSDDEDKTLNLESLNAENSEQERLKLG